MKSFLGLFLALLMFISCDTSQDKATDYGTVVFEEATYEQADYTAPIAMAKRSMGAGSMLQNTNDQQKLIKSATLRYEVYDLDSSLSHISKTLTSHKGLVQNERQYDQGNRKYVSLTLRVPATNFDDFLDELMSSDDIRKLEDKSISAQDVTEQFIDIESRLSTKRQALSRYRDILEKAETVQDIVSIEDKIRRLQEEIEAQEARLKYLSDQVDMSEVRINIYEVVPMTYVPEKGEGFFPKLLKALDNGLEGISVAFFWLIRLWPVWILAIILKFIFHKKSKE